jgi:hypothetical protein
LSLNPAENVFHLTNRVARTLKNLPSKLILICRGRILSRHLTSPLASFGLAAGCTYKLLVIRRPVTPTWLRITAHVLCSSFSPIPLPIRVSWRAYDIKRELRELLRIPALCLSLHRADGELLPDGASLRDLGMRDGERVYCRIHTEDPPPAAAVEAGRVREQIRRAEGGGAAGSSWTECGREGKKGCEQT